MWPYRMVFVVPFFGGEIKTKRGMYLRGYSKPAKVYLKQSSHGRSSSSVELSDNFASTMVVFQD